MEERTKVQIKKSKGKSHRDYEPPGIQIHQEGLKADIKEAGDLSSAEVCLRAL